MIDENRRSILVAPSTSPEVVVLSLEAAMCRAAADHARSQGDIAWAEKGGLLATVFQEAAQFLADEERS